MNKNFIIKIIFIVIILITGYIISTTIKIKDFNLQFKVDKNESTINAQKVSLKGKIIKLPLNFYYIKGNLGIEDKSYIVNRYKKENVQGSLNNDIFRISLIDKNDLEFFNGYARIEGDIINNTVQSMYISIDKTQKNVGSTYGEHINCNIIK